MIADEVPRRHGRNIFIRARRARTIAYTTTVHILNPLRPSGGRTTKRVPHSLPQHTANRRQPCGPQQFCAQTKETICIHNFSGDIAEGAVE